MKINIRKPDVFSLDYLIENGECIDEDDVWLDMYGYVTTDSSGDVVPYCGIAYCLDDDKLDSYYICNSKGIPLTTVCFFSNGQINIYESSYINSINHRFRDLEAIWYDSDGKISSYTKKFDDGISRRFVFDNCSVKRLEIINDDTDIFPTEYEFYNDKQLKRYCFYDVSNVRRNIFWNTDGSISYDEVRYNAITEYFSFDDMKYKLTVFKTEKDFPVLTEQKTENNRIIKSVYEYKMYPGVIMSIMEYSAENKKYSGTVFGVDGKILYETSLSEESGIRTIKEYDSNGSVISDIVLEKKDNKTDILDDYEFVFE